MKTCGLLPIALILLILCPASVLAQQRPPTGAGRLPIIDMHLHAVWWQAYADMAEPLTGLRAPATSEALREATLAALKSYNIVKAVTSGSHVDEYQTVAPDRIIAGLAVGAAFPAPVVTSIGSLRALLAAKQYGAIAEFAPQYDGLTPGDKRLEPYFAVAEEQDIPIGIHMGLGPPGAAYVGLPKYRMALSNPLLLEEVLVRHPKLRIYVMHAGWPMLDQMVGLLYSHPQVYIDIAVINWVLPRAEFHAYLQRLVQAGFADRIMFGSDQMMWPEAFGRAIEAVESADFLTAQQKRDIFYNNAARFLKLTPEQITAHHR